jgi:hypothetical protein
MAGEMSKGGNACIHTALVQAGREGVAAKPIARHFDISIAEDRYIDGARRIAASLQEGSKSRMETGRMERGLLIVPSAAKRDATR